MGKNTKNNLLPMGEREEALLDADKQCVQDKKAVQFEWSQTRF